MQQSAGRAIANSKLARSDIFVTTKVRCCAGGGTPGTGGKDDDDHGEFFVASKTHAIFAYRYGQSASARLRPA